MATRRPRVLAVDDEPATLEVVRVSLEERGFLVLTAPDGELLIWDTPHMDRARAALRELLELPFELVIVAHGEPVHDRAAYERAFELPAWAGEPA